MYLLLLALGALLAAAGIALAALGLPLHGHALDMNVVTPGVVAVVGGLLLVGLGLALRLLQRIERSLVLRAQSAQPANAPNEPVAEPARTLSPAKAPSLPRPPIAVVRAAEQVQVAEIRAPDDVAEPVVTADKIEPAPALNSAASRVDAAVAAEAARRGAKNGSGVGRIGPRLDLKSRASLAAERSKAPAFDSLWPKGPRALRPAQPIAVPETAVPVAESAPAPAAAVEPPAPVPATPEPVTVLKSGVVDGMAYSLYSDGSIEAQLPQGTLRFGSITELRHHIEQSA